MQVLAVEPGHARCQGRGERRRVNTALIGAAVAGEWLLIFIDSAQERISVERAQEINATLDMMEAALQGESRELSVGFSLPSAMSREQLLALSGSMQQTPLEKYLEH
ncbi:HypC/HybG/HupF family hydrogenase formation chaperone [Rhodoferax ferrireducens]|uniref:HypC/HybG/HupF family hydrogenase formation chaperone n=1 Tax=Rhodoferax ferrireducens TaxID=192843 RepID=UPI003B3B2E88